MTIASGVRLGPYEILVPLGAGGMGEVYRARDGRLGREVAIKVLPEAVAGDLERLRRFEQEARAASALNHPNIVTIYDVGRTDGVSWIAMELVQGSSLRQVLAAGALPTKKSLSIGTQIAEGLAKAHASGIVHRDLKPENVMVTSEGLVKVLDFGLAKLAPEVSEGSQVATATRRTEAGVVVGTVGYMSPEQATGRAIDHRSDQFALGAILYEMATGERAFQRATTIETLSAILKEDPAPLSTVNPETPEPLEWIVRRCLAKEPDERYHSTRDLARDLASLRDRSAGAAAAPAARRGRTGRIAAIVLVAFGAAVVSAFFLLGRWSAPGGVHSLAVLPLKSLSGNAEDEALGLGIADTIIRRLSSTGAVTVRPTSAIRRFARGDVDAVAAARELKTDAVLDGTVQRAGGKIRISVNLLRAGDGNSLWADSFDVPVAEVFQVEDAVSDAVVSRLRLRIEPVRMSRLRKHDTANPEAYDAFVRGMSVLGGENASGVDANREASVLFERAVTLDPGYAFAWAKLAESYVLREIFIEPEAGFFEKGQAALARAEQADPQLAENHRVRYQMAWSSRSGFDISKALGELRQARALDPGVGSEELARLYAHIGLEQAYRSALGRTAEIDPSNKALPDVRVSGLYLLGKPAEALALARQLNFDLSSNRLSLALLWEGRFEEARRAAEGELRKSPRGHDAITQRELVAAVTGERPVDEAALAKAEASARRLRTYHHTTYAIAGIRATQGDAPGAVAWLRRTVETGMPNLVLFRADPIFDRVRRAPEFQAFLADIEPVWKRYEQESAGER